MDSCCRNYRNSGYHFTQNVLKEQALGGRILRMKAPLFIFFLLVALGRGQVGAIRYVVKSGILMLLCAVLRSPKSGMIRVLP